MAHICADMSIKFVVVVVMMIDNDVSHDDY